MDRDSSNLNSQNSFPLKCDIYLNEAKEIDASGVAVYRPHMDPSGSIQRDLVRGDLNYLLKFNNT